MQLLQALKPEDKPRQKKFAVTMLDRLDSDPGFLKHVCFSDESTFHVFGLLNRHNLRIWGSENASYLCLEKIYALLDHPDVPEDQNMRLNCLWHYIRFVFNIINIIISRNIVKCNQTNNVKN